MADRSDRYSGLFLSLKHPMDRMHQNSPQPVSRCGFLLCRLGVWFLLCFSCGLISCHNELQRNEIRIYWAGPEPGLNPFTDSSAASEHFQRMLYQRLFDWNVYSDTMCYVLNQITLNFRSTVFTYPHQVVCRLRPDATWNGSSRVVNLEDVLTSLRVQLSIGKGSSSNFLRHHLRRVDYQADTSTQFRLVFDSGFTDSALRYCLITVLPASRIDPQGLVRAYPVNLWISRRDSLDTLAGIQRALAYAASLNKGTDTLVTGSGPYSYRPGPNGFIFDFIHENWGSEYKTANCYFNNYPNRLLYEFNTEPGSVQALLENEQADIVFGLPLQTFHALQQQAALRKHYEFREGGPFPPVILHHRLGWVYRSHTFPGFWEPDLNLARKYIN